MGVEIVYRDEEIEVIHRSGSSLTTLVAFSAIIHRDNEKWYWAASPAEKLDLNCICFSPLRKNYFPEGSVQRAYDCVKGLISGDTIMYGASMGGYAAIKYSGLFKAFASLSFSPQFSVFASDVPFDKQRHVYYSNVNDGMSIRPNDLSGSILAIYDPKHRIDAAHAALIKKVDLSDTIKLLPLHYSGHDTINVMTESRSFSEVYECLAGGDLSLASEKIRSARKNSQTYLLNFARYVCRSGRYKTAKEIWQRARDLGASHAVVYSVEAIELFECGRLHEAELAAMRVLSLDGGNASAFATVGYVFEKMGAKECAIQAYSMSVNLDPRVIKYTMRLTDLFNEAKRYQESRAYALSALEKVVVDAELWGRLGWIELALKNKAEACSAFENAIKINSEIEHFHVGLSKAKA